MSLIGLIPAAGRGTRLHPLPFSKELYPIGYHEIEIQGELKIRPKVVSQYLLNHMVDAGADKIIITVGPGKSDIMEYYGSGEVLGVDISYNFQSTPKGMPFALDLSYKWLKPEDTIVFGMSDTIIEPSNAFEKLKVDFESTRADLMLGTFFTQNPSKFGMVDFDPNSQKVNKTIDKPRDSDLEQMWGCCFWNYKFATFMHETLKTFHNIEKEVVFGDVINKAIEEGFGVFASPVDQGRYMDIGTTEDLDSALKKFHL